MQVLVCVKRVPMVGGRIVLTPDGKQIDTGMLGFTVSPHEECAVEEAVRLVEAARLAGASESAVAVLSLGPPEAVDQLRDAVAVGASRCVLLETVREGGPVREWGPMATAAAIAEAARERGPFDLLLFGNEAADTGDFQVGIRVAHLLGWPVVTGIKALEVDTGSAGGSGSSGASPPARARARREYRGVEELFEFSLPAVVTVKEGINLPRYPSLPGRMRAKKAEIDASAPEWRSEALSMESLQVPTIDRRQAEVLGRGPEAVPALVSLLESLGLLA
ncbi:MAG: electron transfer flavoprotein subunit beta/FixA family protein [Acidimicrobiales bacterium]|jgi:electron transfer flavoprotein beta subunit